jgi:hypothetical protein
MRGRETDGEPRRERVTLRLPAALLERFNAAAERPPRREQVGGRSHRAGGVSRRHGDRPG